MTVTTVSTDAKKDSGQTTTKTETLDVPPASGTRADGYETDRYTVGVSGYSEKPTKEPPKKEEKPPIGDGPKPPEVKPPEQTPTP